MVPLTEDSLEEAIKSDNSLKNAAEQIAKGTTVNIYCDKEHKNKQLVLSDVSLHINCFLYRYSKQIL